MHQLPMISLGYQAVNTLVGFLSGHPNQRPAPIGLTAELQRDGLAPIEQSKDSDIFICSYPRSGITWFSLIVAGLTQGCDVRLSDWQLLNSIVSDVHVRRFYRRFGQVAYFKSHFLPQPRYRRVVYLLRDGRDVMVSYKHFQSALYGPIDFLQFVNETDLWPCAWHEHVSAWLSNPFSADMIVLKYEDLKANPRREILRFCEFAGIDPEESRLDQVIAQTSFEQLRSKEKRTPPPPPWPRDHQFFRRGQIHSHVDEMSPEVLDAFLKKARPTLIRLGYLDA